MPVPLQQLRELIIAWLPRLRRFAHAISDPAECADDLVQRCIEEALATSAQWRDVQHLQSGLFGLLARSCDTPATAAPAVIEPGIAGLRAAYGRLPSPQRVAIALVVLEELSYRDSAQLLEMPLTSLTEHLCSGCEQLSAQLQ